MSDSGAFGGEPLNLGVFLARTVFERHESISTVAHDLDGDWIFRGAERLATGEWDRYDIESDEGFED